MDNIRLIPPIIITFSIHFLFFTILLPLPYTCKYGNKIAMAGVKWTR